MTRKPERTGLGRGLSALLGDLAPEPVPAGPGAPEPQAGRGAGGPAVVPIERVRANPNQPRRDFAERELDELAESIAQRGIIQPVIVRPDPAAPGHYQIVAGERRWRAAQRANLHEVPIIIRTLSDQEAIEIAIIENVQREDLNAIEEGEGYHALMQGHGYTQEDLAKVIGKSRSHLANTLRLLKLPKSVQDLVRDGALSAGHARALIGRPDAAALAARIVKEGLTVRQVEALAQAESAKPKRRKAHGKDANTRAAENELHEALGLNVEIKPGRGEKGELRIRYANFDQFEDIRTRLMRRPGR
jgi:ParB family chromosome partitioning protein